MPVVVVVMSMCQLPPQLLQSHPAFVPQNRRLHHPRANMPIRITCSEQIKGLIHEAKFLLIFFLSYSAMAPQMIAGRVGTNWAEMPA
jgi:ABC-type methionine transport system permease subunit